MEVLIRLRFGEVSDDMLKKEREVVGELKREGKIVRMWRDPCQNGNWTLWNVVDADDLQKAFSRLPMAPYFVSREIHILAEHPVDPRSDGAG